MPLFDFPELAFTQIALLIIGGVWMLQRNDEIPLLISTFIFYFSSYRYWVVTNGWSEWVNITNFGFDPVTNESALAALPYIVFGQICLLTTYMLLQKKTIALSVVNGDRTFFRWLRPKVFFLGLLCLPIVIIIRRAITAQLEAGASLAFGVSSYLYLFPMLLVGVATLIFCLWKFGGLPTLGTKFIAVLLLLSVAFFTYNPTSRFQFLAWLISGGIILCSSYKPKNRLIIFAISAVFVLIVFTFAGAMRNVQTDNPSEQAVLQQAALERAFGGDDANMLDGFALMQQIYPKYLDYSWGMEHFHILLRPIPRALWAGKPVGGYMNKLGLTVGGKGTLGISQSLFGSFYEEGALFGILFFSVIYGIILARIVSYSTQLQPFAGVLIRAIVCACLIPLLRGGDLPGIYAWFGMAFWPCFLMLWVKRKYFKYKQASWFYFNYPVEMFNNTANSQLPSRNSFHDTF